MRERDDVRRWPRQPLGLPRSKAASKGARGALERDGKGSSWRKAAIRPEPHVSEGQEATWFLHRRVGLMKRNARGHEDLEKVGLPLGHRKKRIIFIGLRKGHIPMFTATRVLQYCEEFRSPIARMRFPSKDELSSSHTCSSSGGAGLFHIVCGSGVGHNADVAFGSMLSKKSLCAVRPKV